MSKFSEIQSLLDRYWEGETTLEEERTLKAYFASGQVDERLLSVAPLFQALREEQAVQAGGAKVIAFRPRVFAWHGWAAAAAVALLLSAGLWWQNGQKEPVFQPVVQQAAPPALQENAAQQTPAVENRAPVNEPPKLVEKTPVRRKKPSSVVASDPEAEKAMEEIKAALALLSSKMKKGKREAAKGAVHLEQMDRIFKKKSEG